MKLIAELNLTDLTPAEFAAYEARCAAMGITPAKHLAGLIRAEVRANAPAAVKSTKRKGVAA